MARSKFRPALGSGDWLPGAGVHDSHHHSADAVSDEGHPCHRFRWDIDLGHGGAVVPVGRDHVPAGRETRKPEGVAENLGDPIGAAPGATDYTAHRAESDQSSFDRRRRMQGDDDTARPGPDVANRSDTGRGGGADRIRALGDVFDQEATVAIGDGSG